MTTRGLELLAKSLLDVRDSVAIERALRHSLPLDCIVTIRHEMVAPLLISYHASTKRAPLRSRL